MASELFPRRLWKESFTLLLVSMLVSMPLLMPFTQGASGRALRNGLCESIGVLLLVVMLARLETRGGLRGVFAVARSGINLPVAAFVLWAALGVLRAPDRAFATGELLRLGTGALVYFAAALHLETRAQLRLFLDCLLGVVILLVGYGLLSQGGEMAGGSGTRIASMFHSSLQLGAVLAILLPLVVSLAALGEDEGRRMAAIAAAILCGAGVLLCLERSAWIASGVGIGAWVFFAGRPAAGARAAGRQSGRLVFAAFCLLLSAFWPLAAATDVQPAILGQARGLERALHGRDHSFGWRLGKWRGAWAMAAARPVWGWGPGQFVLFQLRYTHRGLLPEVMRRYGASYDDMAFNEYLQTAAELGFPGLALYLLLLGCFFSKAIRALRLLPQGLRRATLLGCIAGTSAQMVDAMANGSWRYTECMLFFWLLLGLGVAVIRMAYRHEGGGEAGAGRGVIYEEESGCPRSERRAAGRAL